MGRALAMGRAGLGRESEVLKGRRKMRCPFGEPRGPCVQLEVARAPWGKPSQPHFSPNGTVI